MASRITVVGTGYVGLVTGACLAAIGHDVTCVDTRADLVRAIGEGRAPFYEPGLEPLLTKVLRAGRLRATSDLEQAVAGSDATLIAVGTPFHDGRIDLTAVTGAATQIGTALRRHPKYHVVVVKSTVVPGTTDTVVRSALESASGLRAGAFGLAMNPEFLREGTAVDDFMQPDRIVIGEWDERSGDAIAALYGPFDVPIVRTTLRNAELIKYSSNALLATLISFSNELGALCETIDGTDVEVVTDGLHLDRRLSPVVAGQRVYPGILGYIRAGIGYGGSCLPKDVAALRAFARERGLATPLLDAVEQTNGRRPEQVLDLLALAAGDLAGLTVAVLGVAFKEDTDDLRSSPALALINRLIDRGANVRVYDGIVKAETLQAVHAELAVCDSPERALTGADAAVVTMASPAFRHWDWTRLCGLMRKPIVLDGRNILRGVTLPENAVYLPIGRRYRTARA